MSSPRRHRRSASPDRKSDRRMPDLASTRRDYDDYPTNRYRGSRPRRPFGGPRRPRGRTTYRSFSERSYPTHDRYDSRSRKYSSSSQRQRSRSRGHSRSRGRSHSRSRSHSRNRHRSRSASRGKGQHSRSRSSGSSRSRSTERRRPHSSEGRTKGGKPVKHYLREDRSATPDKGAPTKKKPRHAESESSERHGPSKSRADSGDRKKSLSSQRQRSYTGDNYSEEEESYRRSKKSKEDRRASPQPSSTSTSHHSLEKKHFVAKNKLHNIFTVISRDENFELEEDISIAIQRNPYAEPSEESTVKKVFDDKLFSVIRNLEEGQKPIFDREEIKKFGHDSNLADDPDFERRVIRLKPGKSSQEAESSHSSSSHSFKSSAKNITRVIERGRRSMSRSRSRSGSATPSRRREPEVRLKMKPDPRYEAKYKEIEKKEGCSSKKLDPQDLRHELRGSSSKASGDLRNRLEKREKEKDETPWLSVKEEDPRRDRDAPDFSRRKDKYTYAEWMDKPEMIPKHPNYFQHDNRDERDSWDSRDRGRGRGFRGRTVYRRPFRGFRGSSRPPFRGRPYHGGYSSDRRTPPPTSRSRYEGSKRDEGEWKHDKFAELEGGESRSHRDDEQHVHSTSER